MDDKKVKIELTKDELFDTLGVLSASLGIFDIKFGNDQVIILNKQTINWFNFPNQKEVEDALISIYNENKDKKIEYANFKNVFDEEEFNRKYDYEEDNGITYDFGFSYNGKEWALEIYKVDIKEDGNVVYNPCYEENFKIHLIKMYIYLTFGLNCMLSFNRAMTFCISSLFKTLDKYSDDFFDYCQTIATIMDNDTSNDIHVTIDNDIDKYDGNVS